MRTRKRIYPYVTPDLARRLTTYCAAKGITESSAVQTAVEDHLDGEAKDNDVILRRLDRLGRESLGHQRTLAVLTESFSVFARMCFLYFPPMVETEKSAAERLSGKRYLYLVDLVSKQLATGSGLVADIAKNPSSGAAASAGTSPLATPGAATPPWAIVWDATPARPTSTDPLEGIGLTAPSPDGRNRASASPPIAHLFRRAPTGA